MKLTTTTRRLAATGAAAAMAAGALVGATTTAASAAEVTTEYTCELAIAGLGPWDVTVVSDVVGIDLFTALPAGFDVKDENSLSVTNHFTIPDNAYENLGGYSVEDISFPDYAGDFGGNDVLVEGMTAKVSEMVDNGDGTHSFDSDGSTAEFEAPAAGMHDVLAPGSFSMVADAPGVGQVPVPCNLATGTDQGVYHSISVFKNDSSTIGKPAAKTLKVGKVAKLKAVVSAPNENPGGKVLVKEGKKTLGKAKLNKAGKGTVKLGKLKKGKHTVTVVYKGDGYTNKSTSEPIKFKVTK